MNTLEGDQSGLITAQVGVLSSVHFAHAPLADLFKDFVVRDGLADHRSPPYRNAVGPNVKSRGVLKAIKITLKWGLSWLE
ncbi:MAG: hypothetical protein O7G29_09710 [Acidobacteria bacterium]|nr:hypothetical protein [Acidobacteriota bacterium]